MSAPTRASVCTICRCSIYLYTLHFYLPVVDRWSRSWRGIYCAQCRAQSRLDDSCVLRDACVVESGPYLSILIESPGFDLFAMLLWALAYFFGLFSCLCTCFSFSLASLSFFAGHLLSCLALPVLRGAVLWRSVWSRGALFGLAALFCVA